MPPGQLQFDNQSDYAPPQAASEPSLITGLVIKWGLAKDPRSASYVLLGVALAAVALAFVVPSLLSSGGTTLPHTGNTATYVNPAS